MEDGGEPVVALATADSSYRATFKLIEELGTNFVSRGERVFIKYSMHPFASHLPNPMILLALMRICRDCGASVSVGDSPPHWISPSALESLTGLGSFLRKRVEFSFTDDRREYLYTRNDKAVVARELWVSRKMMEADRLILISSCHPSPATTIDAGICAMEGAIHPSHHPLWRTTRDVIAHKMADVLLRVKPSLTVVDMWRVGFESSGSLRMLVGGTDVVAVDAIASYLIGYDPMDLKVVSIPHQRGVGCGDMGRMRITGEDPDTHRMKVLPPELDGKARVLIGRGPTIQFIRSRPMCFPEDPSMIDGMTSDGLANPCDGCISSIISAGKLTSVLLPREKYTTLVGMHPPEPEEGPVIVWGDCACESTKDYEFRKLGDGTIGGYVQVRGCPPHWTNIMSLHEVLPDRGKHLCGLLVRKIVNERIHDLLEFLQGNHGYMLKLMGSALR